MKGNDIMELEKGIMNAISSRNTEIVINRLKDGITLVKRYTGCIERMRSENLDRISRRLQSMTAKVSSHIAKNSISQDVRQCFCDFQKCVRKFQSKKDIYIKDCREENDGIFFSGQSAACEEFVDSDLL
ncbi:MAG TPA: hypothetical protein IAA30_08420 [Candidatus Treponema faecavium]|nr:hypothetical protein [Candidatus Treponema faecavium]